MPITRGSLITVASVLSLGLFVACGSGTDGDQLPVDGFWSSSGSSGSEDDLGLDGSGDGSGDGQSGAGGACGTVDVTFEQVLPTVVLLIDQSGSMTEDFGNGYSRWGAVKHALIDPTDGVVVKLDGKMRFGVTLYTSHNGDQGGVCPELTEVAPAMGNGASIKNMLDGSWPEQDTPTAESLAATAAALGQEQEPGNKVIVLATDGMPDTCADPHNQNQTSQSIAAVQAAHAAGIDTYVIGVGDGVSSAHLQDLADAGVGQNNAPYYQALNPQSLVDDFNQIVAGVQDCVFSVDGEIDPDLVCQGQVFLDGNELGCNDPDGWQLNSPTQIELVGAACQAIQDGNHTVVGEFPCGVIVPPTK